MVYIEVASGVSIDSNHQHDTDRMSRELFWEIEQQLIMHKIAKEYYGFRYVRYLLNEIVNNSKVNHVYLISLLYDVRSIPIYLQSVLVSTSTTSFDDNIHYHHCIYTIQP